MGPIIAPEDAAVAAETSARGALGDITPFDELESEAECIA
jgi:hypothetical protein